MVAGYVAGPFAFRNLAWPHGNRALNFCKPNIQGNQDQNTTRLALQTTLYEEEEGQFYGYITYQ
jgi:hypothetical protein